MEQATVHDQASSVNYTHHVFELINGQVVLFRKNQSGRVAGLASKADLIGNVTPERAVTGYITNICGPKIDPCAELDVTGICCTDILCW